MNRLCPYCNKPIVLVPSAIERAKKSGGKPSDYTNLFPYHADYFVADRSRQAYQLIDFIKGLNTIPPTK